MITATTPSADPTAATPTGELLAFPFLEAGQPQGPEFIDFLLKHSAVPSEDAPPELEKLAVLDPALSDPAAAMGMQNLPVPLQVGAGLPANFAAQRELLESELAAVSAADASPVAPDPLAKELADALLGDLAAEVVAEANLTSLPLSAPALVVPPQSLQAAEAVAQSVAQVAAQSVAQVAADAAAMKTAPVTAPELAALSANAAMPTQPVTDRVGSSPFQNSAQQMAAMAGSLGSLDMGNPADVTLGQAVLSAPSASNLAGAAPLDPKTANVLSAASPMSMPLPDEAAKTESGQALPDLAQASPVSSEATQVTALSEELLASGDAVVQPLSAGGDTALGGSSAQAGASVAPAAVVQSPLLASLGDSANVSRQPIEPHLMRLDTGPVQVEVLKMVQQGGGQIVLELTPPDQGTYRIDLRLDMSGRAQLLIEGASDSVRTRLEQGESGLREQFAQMGLDLQLNFRQSDLGSRMAQDDANDFNVGSMNQPEAPVDSRASRSTVGMEQALVHLYA